MKEHGEVGGGGAGNFHRKAAKLYFFFIISFWWMDYYLSGRPARRLDLFGYPKEGQVGNPHLLHSVPPSLKREN